MKLLLLTLVFAGHAYAGTQILFARDGKKATVLLLAVTQNPDAQKLYDVMNVAPQEQQGKLTKHIALTNSDGEKVSDLICAFSKLAAGTGSCTVTINAARGASISAASNHASVDVQGAEGAAFAALFTRPTANGEVYVSSDSHLKITVAESASRAAGFRLSYE